MFVLPPIRFSRKCPRCGSRYPAKAEDCIHCRGLSDEQVQQLKHRRQLRHESHSDLGRLFIYIALLLVVGLLIFKLR